MMEARRRRVERVVRIRRGRRSMRGMVTDAGGRSVAFELVELVVGELFHEGLMWGARGRVWVLGLGLGEDVTGELEAVDDVVHSGRALFGFAGDAFHHQIGKRGGDGGVEVLGGVDAVIDEEAVLTLVDGV